jgi:hypothetical protein
MEMKAAVEAEVKAAVKVTAKVAAKATARAMVRAEQQAWHPQRALPPGAVMPEKLTAQAGPT